MRLLLSFLVYLCAFSLMLSGSLLALQGKMGPSEIMLVALTLKVIAELIANIGNKNGNNKHTESTLPGSSKL